MVFTTSRSKYFTWSTELEVIAGSLAGAGRSHELTFDYYIMIIVLKPLAES